MTDSNPITIEISDTLFYQEHSIQRLTVLLELYHSISDEEHQLYPHNRGVLEGYIGDALDRVAVHHYRLQKAVEEEIAR